jgi:hypothetical protein
MRVRSPGSLAHANVGALCGRRMKLLPTVTHTESEIRGSWTFYGQAAGIHILNTAMDSNFLHSVIFVSDFGVAHRF